MSAHVVERDAYRLELAEDGMAAGLWSGDKRWMLLRPFAAVDTVDGPDETLEVEPPRALGEGCFELVRRSTRWERASTTIECGRDTVSFEAAVEGRGRVADVHLLGGRSLLPRRSLGFLQSGLEAASLFSPSPEDPARMLYSARERVVIGVVGGDAPGRGHWFFTPAPLYVAVTDDETEWLTVGLAADVDRLGFTRMVYEPGDRAFSLRLEYDGRTEVDGSFRAPTVVVTPAVRDPYEGLRRHRDDLGARGFAPEPDRRDVPEWWSEPIFCGWGAQCALAGAAYSPAAELSTQANYDLFLSQLAAERVVPGTVVIDDKWQETYGECVPDTAKWPDLRHWIAARHEQGQHVLLWWKAWDPEGLPPELCITNADGVPLALDPTNPRASDALRETIMRMLSPDALDADGLKVDFTAQTPSGHGVSTFGPGWGIALLHELLATVYEAAKRAKPDALIVTQTPHPSFVDVTDMIRLNDMLRLRDIGAVPEIVPQMRFRAAVVEAACPELLVDTDDWCAPNLEQWHEYLEVKPLLGVPSLYYSQSLDFTGERFEPRDYVALRLTWERWRAAQR